MKEIRAEVIKLVSVRSTWLILGSMVLIEGLYASLAAGVPDVNKIDNPTDLFVGTGMETVLVFCLGALMATNEFRYGTANSTFLVTPRRERVIIAKLVVALVAGIVAALLFVAVNAGFGYSILSSRDIQIDGDDAVNIYLGTAIGMVLTCLFGVGLGALLRNQVVSVVLGIVIFFVFRGVAEVVGAPGDYFPSESLIGLQGALGDSDTLNQVPGGFVFAAYCIAFAVAGSIATRGRDIAGKD